MTYLDHNATSPLRARALERMLPWLQQPGNPSSLHVPGQRARGALDDAREELAAALGCEPRELVFTSGGTESDNLALRGVLRPGGRLVTTKVEHPAVRRTARALAGLGVELVELGVDRCGRLDWDEVDAAITPETSLVSVMWVNSETGVRFPIERLALLCRERGARLHVDAVQAFGKVELDLSRVPVDLLSVSAHKVGGPVGVGALFVRRGGELEPSFSGGLQERGRRPGTENVAGAVGFAAAASLATSERASFLRACEGWSDAVRASLGRAIPDAHWTGTGADRVPSTVHLCVPGVQGESLVAALDLAGLAASSGSACSSGSLEPSHVLEAMGMGAELIGGPLRLSFGHTTTQADIDHAIEAIARTVERLRSRR